MKKIMKIMKFIENQPPIRRDLYETEPEKDSILNGMNCILDVLVNPNHFNEITDLMLRDCEKNEMK